jgi:hypothetical protein
MPDNVFVLSQGTLRSRDLGGFQFLPGLSYFENAAGDGALTVRPAVGLPVKFATDQGGLPNFAAPQAVTQSGSWTVGVTGSVAVTGALTDAQLRAAAVPVSGTFWQATQPVSGPLTDVQLRATAVPVAQNVRALTTREYLATGARRTFTATSAEVALPTLGAGREIYVYATENCFVRTGTSGVTAADDGNSHPVSLGLPWHFQVPAGHTHIAVVRMTADGTATIRAVNG